MTTTKNIIYIHTHDSGRILSPYGYDVPTPSLKKFAEDATLFRQAYCVGPTCSPSRAGLLTGMYPHSNGMLGLSQRGFGLHDYSHHLVRFLKNRGYQTVLCGIQHEVGSYLNPEEGAKTIGYDENISADNSGYAEEELVKWDYNNALRVKEWLRNVKKDKPFFLSYGLFATHRRFPKEKKEGIDSKYVMPPYPVIDNEVTREDYTGYLVSSSWFDDSFKVVIETLKEEGLYDNSIIIFTTDHGIPFPFSKCNLTDAGIGVSLIMRVPESSSKGEVIDGLVSQVDLFPTLCDLLNIEKPENLQGISFAEMFEDRKAKVREEIFAEVNFHTSYEPVRCIRTSKYKYIRYYDEDYLKVNMSNIDNSPTKDFYLKNGLDSVVKYREALYDLTYDPGERSNVIEDARYASVADDMRRKLDDYQQKTDDPLLTGHIQVKDVWKVNKQQCVNPSSKDPNDYV
ncbi:Arylsulfatase A [Evansella caseinilytica]|uniref:Arylsulfatase A n=1 Tax=Evansella caseinilytica TaxID=1503961 RepID=A0A1H3UTH5_9BACI|nr:sulfatase [Evansella caseinilytica]SDZ65760.1 Arylsulfatase A [Evansella caseinilytica]